MNETIVAIATANGVGSITIIRISGSKSLLIAKKLTKKDKLTPRHAYLTPLFDSENELIDEVITLYFKGPHSFTAEDIIEFQCHGGQVVAEKILKIVISEGVRLANPGEFSKRAFFNGRIDLTEAEAIAQLIEAKSEDAAKILAKQMKGSLKHYVEDIRDQLLEILAYSEVTIDYAEEDLPEDLILQIMSRLNNIYQNLSKTLNASESRRGLMQGFKVSIIGKPNVGKSSLLNAMLNYNRAIVSEIAGTTRDTIEEEVRVGTHLIRIVDTAGIRESNDEIERIGIERSMEAIAESDIVIAIFDGSRKVDEEDSAIMDLIKANEHNRSFILVVNKSDLKQNFELKSIHSYSPLYMSCKSETQNLIERLKTLMDSKNISDEMMLISLRQIEAVKETLKNINEAKYPLEDQELEIFSFHINRAILAISSITRPFENDEMLDKMFGSFCLGK